MTPPARVGGWEMKLGRCAQGGEEAGFAKRLVVFTGPEDPAQTPPRVHEHPSVPKAGFWERAWRVSRGGGWA